MKIEKRTFIVSGGCVPAKSSTIHSALHGSHSSSGLGLATAQLLLDGGGYIAVLDLAEPPINNERVKFLRTDITNVEEIERAVEHAAVWAKGAGAPLGGVINCAGVGTAAKVRLRIAVRFQRTVTQKMA